MRRISGEVNKMTEEICKKCGGKFHWEIINAGYPGGKDKEEIICPHCGEINGHRMTAGTIWTEKV